MMGADAPIPPVMMASRLRAPHGARRGNYLHCCIVVFPPFGRCNFAKCYLMYSRRGSTLYSCPVPHFPELLPLKTGGWGKRGTTGLVASSVVPEFPLRVLRVKIFSLP